MRPWLVLGRLSNLPTIWTNVTAGAVAAGASPDSSVAVTVVAVSLLYTGGMVLNDLVDIDHDRAHRSTRPLVAGSISPRGAGAALVILMAAGLGLVMATRIGAVVWAVALVLAIVYYDVRHKHDPLAPVVMGVCRGLVYCVAAAVTTGAVPAPVLWAGVILALYVAAFTYAARYIPPFRPWVSLAIASISVIDAAVLLTAGMPGLAMAALVAVPVTLMFQRWIPGD